MKYGELFLAETITDFRSAGNAKELVGHAQIGPHKVTLGFTPYGDDHYSANYTVDNSISRNTRSGPSGLHAAAIAHTVARSVDHFVRTHKPRSISMQSYDNDPSIEDEKSQKYAKMANYLAVKHGGRVEAIQDRHFDSPKHVVVFREGDDVHWASMPTQTLHADTHATLTRIGYDHASDDESGIKKTYRKNWLRTIGLQDTNLEDHLPKHGWYRLGSTGGFSGGSIYNHPNGNVLIDDGSHIEMYGNFRRGDR